MRHFAITGIVTDSWISRILSGSAMRATPPSLRMSAGTRSSAITATAPASSAIRACSASVTSMITPPFSISARPLLTRIVPVSAIALILARRRPTAATWVTAEGVDICGGGDEPSLVAAVPTKELRLAIVCYGGSSLAVYMHGVTKELHRLVKGSALLDSDGTETGSPSERVYRRL